ncbi:putative kelch motif domain-containing protein [Neospora caninum Liverpool]|uniref:Putative kelch motif domain-containing protein n=1 Tax=Neospora caninum (strain Liverpool) TaxID=572307 RepID=F0VJ20_NEOCL|nr:putative kelch motif domain-containing protein [Neospora caninum Liverpool]CBZ53731.1 putative kelch motif domain-containing protein [Neospora caninum Liverpool]|eukprot:XP_003883763.1 putative kelch motif domain-containing protein [Neospora caninum Liverpool]
MTLSASDVCGSGESTLDSSVSPAVTPSTAERPKPSSRPVGGGGGDTQPNGEPSESDASRETEDQPWFVLAGGNEERRPVDVAYKLFMAPSGLLGVRPPDEEPEPKRAVGSSKHQTPENGPLLVPELALPKLQIPRYGHVACVTSGRDVLLVGGKDGHTVLNSVERLEETEGRWVSMPSLHFARAHHAGCAVSGGRAVVLGGENDKGVLKSVELYHPVKRNWINLAPMQHQRHSFGAVAIGANIFALGGRDAAGDHGRVLKTVEGLSLAPLASPACSRSSSVATAPGSPAGVPTETQSRGASGPGAQTPQKTATDRADSSGLGSTRQGSVGEGGTTHGAGSAAVEGWRSLPSMKNGRASFGVAQYKGVIFCAGGTNGVKPLSSVEMFDSSTNEWFQLPSLNEARIGPVCFVWLKGPERRPHLCVAGGRQSSLHPVFQSAEILDLLPLLPRNDEDGTDKTEGTGQGGSDGEKKRQPEGGEKLRRETEIPPAQWILVSPVGVKLCWQQAAGVVSRCWKDLRGDAVLQREVMSRNLEEAEEESSDADERPPLPKTRVFRSNSSSSTASVNAAPSEAPDRHGACAGDKGPSKVQMLRQKIESQAAERQAAAAKKTGTAGAGVGGIAGVGGKHEVVYDPLEWFES